MQRFDYHGKPAPDLLGVPVRQTEQVPQRRGHTELLHPGLEATQVPDEQAAEPRVRLLDQPGRLPGPAHLCDQVHQRGCAVARAEPQQLSRQIFGLSEVARRR